MPLQTTTAQDIATAFAKHWGFLYSRSNKLRDDNGKQSTPRLFTDACRMLGIANLYTTKYPPRMSSQVEQLSCSLLVPLCHYGSKHPRSWDEFTDAIKYTFDTQPHSCTSFVLFKLLLARPQPTMAVDACAAIMRMHYPRQ